MVPFTSALNLTFIRQKENRSQKNDINVNVFTPADMMDYVRDKVRAHKGFAIATVNLDHMVKLSSNKTFLKAYQEHPVIVADGFPIVLIGRLMGAPVSKTTGSDTFLPLLSLAAQEKAKVAFIGSTKEVLTKACAKLKGMTPDLDIVFLESPPFGFDPEGTAATELLQRLKESRAQLCFLALGAPKQEILAARGLSLCPETGFFSIGASLDFIAGAQKRAPLWAQKTYLEWLWRMGTNPKRLGLRYLLCALHFPSLLVRSLFGKKEST